MSELESSVVVLPKKRALLDALLKEGGISPSVLPRIMPRSSTGACPLSFAQQRLWFLDQLAPGNPFYNADSAVRLSYPINASVLQRALNEIIRRHESLRTTFSVDNGSPVQSIASHLELPLPVIDLRQLPPAERDAEALRIATEEARSPFDLARGPLIRSRLLQVGDAEYVFLVTLHHIICDGWSLGLFWNEITSLYTSFAAGRPSFLSDLPIQYGDFAVWQRERLQGPELDRQLEYWRTQLADLSLLQLPTDHPRPPLKSYRGAYHLLTLPSSLITGIKTLARQEDVTLFMTLLAAFQTLLHRYTSQDQIVVGSPIAGRSRAELEGIIGFFVNTLVLRTDLSGDPSFRELLHRVRVVALAAYAHQELPFEILVQKLQPERDLSRNPLFQVIFQHLDVAERTQQTNTPGLTPLPVQRGTSKFDLLLDTWETPNGLEGQFVYDTDLFDQETIIRMAGHLRILLESIVSHPDRPVSQLPLLTPQERQQVLLAFNDTVTNYPRQKCIHQLFEAQVEQAFDSVALIFGEEQITYGELNRRANQVARYLVLLGVKPTSMVAFCLPRGIDLVGALLGILKAGAVYVPLDPDYPKERLAFILQDTQASILLTMASLEDMLPGSRAKIICLDREAVAISQHGHDNPLTTVDEGQLAYVMYTSGSTGKPKGVCIPHRAVIRLVENTNYIQIDASDRVAQASDISFDAATFEIWGALLNGAQLIGLSREVALSPPALANYLRQEGITTLFLTTALFNQVAQEEPGAFSSLRNLLFGGEAVDPRWVRQVLRRNPPERLLNVYGPTETTTFATWHLVQDLPSTATTVPIGRPISNAEVYILDRHFQPLPIGVFGELYVGGDGLAAGYLNRPELTAEKFVPHPFTVDPGDRLYKTGDLARWRHDGILEFLGRLDCQVKVRGFRIELGEVEAALRQHPNVREAVVVVRQNEADEKQLVAYLIPKADLPIPYNVIREFLLGRLPIYMIPSRLQCLETLPRLPNGKVDRQALPDPDPSRPNLQHDYSPPCGPVEEALASIFADVLALERVGVHDNFFTNLGGHSLLATQLISRVRSTFNLEIPLRTLFEAPTVANFAMALKERQLLEPDNGESGPVRIERVSRDHRHVQVAEDGSIALLPSANKTP